VALCPRCWADLRCAHCRAWLTVEELLDHLTGPGPQGTDTGEPVSSAGRAPLSASPRTRAAFTTPAEPAYIANVAKAERQVALAEEDKDRAFDALRLARSVAPEAPEGRVLGPEDLAALERVRAAADLAARAENALTVARRRLAAQLEQFDRAVETAPAWWRPEGDQRL
jgi:hypothetical protein